jgi:hypothetical protein
LNALLLALAIFSGTVSASPSVHLTYDSPTVRTVAAPVAVVQPAKPVAVPAKIAKPVAKPKTLAPAPAAKPVPAPSVVKDNITTPAQLPVCDDEDDEMLSGGKTVKSCYWDAKAHGTGKGTSFVKYSTGSGTQFRYLK